MKKHATGLASFFLALAVWAAPSVQAWTTAGAGNMSVGRRFHNATLLPDGRVLVEGGTNGLLGELATAEIFDPSSGTWTTTGSMSSPRSYGFTATLLKTGKVLVVGGGISGAFLSSAELYDPASGTWSTTGSMSVAREQHTAALLPNGKVLVAGGINAGGYLSNAEIYDPATGQWTPTAAMATARAGHRAVALADGRVLVVAGGNGGILGSAEIYDPSSNSWTATGSMNSLRDTQVAALLPSGKVLIAGGNSGLGALVSAEVYDPASGTWTTTSSMMAARASSALAVMGDGRVLVAGGVNTSFLASSEIYDPRTGNWTSAGDMSSPRADQTMTALNDGRILAVGGYTSPDTYLPSAEIFDGPPLSRIAWVSVTNSSVTVSWLLASPSTQAPLVVFSTAADFSSVLSSGVGPLGLQTTSYAVLDNTTYYFKMKIAGAPDSNYSVVMATLTSAAPPVKIVFDDISTSAITASAYAPSPAFSNLSRGASGVNVAIGPDYLYGGWRNGDVWRTRAPTPQMTASAVAAGLSGRMLLVRPYLCLEYDVLADTWMAKTPPSIPSYGMAGGILGRTFYAVGGSPSGIPYAVPTEAYDLTSDTWSFRSSLPGVRFSPVVAGVSGKLYAIGGYGAGLTGETDEYNPAMDRWSLKASMPTQRWHTAAAVIGTKIFVVGGDIWNAAGSAYLPTGNNEIYDTASGIWAAGAPMPHGRYNLAAGAIGGKLYVVGGNDGVSNYVQELDEYDPSSDVWTTKAPMPTGRAGLAAAVDGGKLYAIGGYDNPELYVNEEYDPGVSRRFIGLNSNTRYSFKAKARNAAGIETPETAVFSVYTLATKPSGTAAVSVGASTVDLGWSSNGNPAPATLYEVWRATAPDFSSPVIVTVAATAAQSAGLASETSYYFKVRAVNGDGVRTDFDRVVVARTLRPVPGAPAAPSGTALGVSSIAWSWSALSGAPSYYRLVRAADGATIATTTALGAVQAGLAPNRAYAAACSATNATGEGPLSPAATAWTLSAPPAGTAASAVFVTSAAISWGLNGNPAGTVAEVQRSTDGASFAAVFSGSATALVDSGLASCTTYYYRVRDANGAGILSAFDAPVSLRTSAVPPAPPNSLAASPAADDRVALAWLPSVTPGVFGYRLYYDRGSGTINYASPIAVFASSETSWLTPPLASSSAYAFALRAVNGCGVEETGGVFALSAATGAVANVRAVIKTPDSGKRIEGNSVTVMAVLAIGTPERVSRVLFQYRPSGSGDWIDIPARESQHPNPDPDAPYFIHSGADSWGVGSYDLRAVAFDLSGTPDHAPPAVTIRVVSSDADIDESLIGGKVSKRQTVDDVIPVTIAAAGEADHDPSVVIGVPPGALGGSTVAVTVVSNPTITVPPPAGYAFVGSAARIDLGNGMHYLAGGKTATVALSYPAAVLDTNGLQVRSYDETLGDWSLLPIVSIDAANRTITAATPHFSLFAVVAAAASDLSGVRAYPVPFEPNGGDPNAGRPYSAGDPDSGVVFDRLPAGTTVKIYTLSGRLVRELSGDGRIQWDARTSDGRDAASGGYLAVVSAPGNKSVVKKLVIIR